MSNEKVIPIDGHIAPSANTPVNDEQLAIGGSTPDDREEMNCAIAALLTENAKGFELMLSDFRRDCKPVNAAEDALVQMMARHFWGALRKTRIETGLVETQIEWTLSTPTIRGFAEHNDMTDPGVNFEFDTRRLGLAFDSDCGRNKSQMAITRVAAASDTGFLKAYSMLLRAQSLRPVASQRKRLKAA